jgi:Ran GTPase-activating protein (RanGAP) involved in mRNA processing and transport
MCERLAGVLGQCRELVHLDLSYNKIGAAGAERLAGVLGQCAALAHLNLGYNQIGDREI